MRISDWSSDVCSSDLVDVLDQRPWEEAILFAVERSARGDAIYKAACSAAIRAAFEVDPVLAGEMIFRATDEVWAPIGTEMRSLAEQLHAPGKVDRAVRFMIASGKIGRATGGERVGQDV